MDLSKLIDWIKLSPRYLIPFSLISGFLIFADEEIVGFFGLNEFTKNNLPYIGIVFLLSSGLILSGILISLLDYGKGILLKLINRKKIKEFLKNLTLDQKEILKHYFINNTRSQDLKFSDGSVRELEDVGIIYRASSIAIFYTTFSYNINTWVWKYISKDLHVLD